MGNNDQLLLLRDTIVVSQNHRITCCSILHHERRNWQFTRLCCSVKSINSIRGAPSAISGCIYHEEIDVLQWLDLERYIIVLCNHAFTEQYSNHMNYRNWWRSKNPDILICQWQEPFECGVFVVISFPKQYGYDDISNSSIHHQRHLKGLP